jgi:hypothetical protein
MSLDQKQDWITGEEYGNERVRLIKAGVPNDAPEFRAPSESKNRSSRLT